MLQKAAEMRLFAFKTSQLRSCSVSTPLLVRSDNFCYVCTDENHRAVWGLAPAGFNHYF